jgi:hypothetical protein
MPSPVGVQRGLRLDRSEYPLFRPESASAYFNFDGRRRGDAAVPVRARAERGRHQPLPPSGIEADDLEQSLSPSSRSTSRVCNADVRMPEQHPEKDLTE